MANLRKTVYEHISSGRDKFLDLMVDLAERAVDDVDDSMDIDEAVNDAIDTGMIYTDVVSNIERVADHATNIAFSIMTDVKKPDLTD